MRYIYTEDAENEQYKIIDTGTVIGGDAADYMWLATAYEERDAAHICGLLNATPHAPVSK